MKVNIYIVASKSDSVVEYHKKRNRASSLKCTILSPVMITFWQHPQNKFCGAVPPTQKIVIDEFKFVNNVNMRNPQPPIWIAIFGVAIMSLLGIVI